MFGWVTNWWSSGSFTGPARNAPNNGKNIKAMFDQRPKQVIVLTDVEIKTLRISLKKTETNVAPPESQDTPIFKELDSVFKQGNKNYFDNVPKYIPIENSDELAKRSKEAKLEARNRVLMIMKQKRDEMKAQASQNDNSLAAIKKRNAEERLKRKEMKASGIPIVKDESVESSVEVDALTQNPELPSIQDSEKKTNELENFTSEEVLNGANEFSAV